jgi:hypothetical protein
MTFETNVSTPPAAAQETERIRACDRVVKKLGHWTTARSFDVRAARGSVVLDLRSPRIAARTWRSGSTSTTRP